MVKSIALVLVLIALLGLCAYTNPTLEEYESFVHQEILQAVNKESRDEVDQVLGGFLGGLASKVFANQTVRKDYVFLSTYNTSFGKEHLISVGVLKNFMILENPESLKKVKNEGP